MKIGIQVSSVRPLLKSPEQVRVAFAKMAALGCGAVQLQWIDPSVSIPCIAGAMGELGLKSLGTQDFYDAVCAGFEYYVNLNTATGGKYLTVSRIPERLKSREGLDAFVGELRAMQKRLDPLGQKLLLHPVTADFNAVPGMDAVAYLLEAMPELSLCLDGFHLNRCCGDMPGFIRRYAGRIPLIHFKDARQGRLVPAGSGEVNWTGVIQACLDAGVEYGLAEQETWDSDPYECLGQAMDWLGSQLK